MLQVKRSSILLTVLLAVGLVISSAALPAKVDPVTLPEGTPVHVRLDSTLSTKHARPGEPFAATVSQPVDVDGKTVIPQGAHVTGRVIEAKESGRFSGTPEMRLAL